MKRADEARVIKIAETAAPGGSVSAVGTATAAQVIAATTGGASVVNAAATASTGASGTTIFPTRPLVAPEMPQQPLSVSAAAAVAASQQPQQPPAAVVPQPQQTPITSPAGTNFTRVMPHNSVSVFRGGADGGVAITQVSANPPPAAHSATLHPSQTVQQQQPIVTQPPSNLKPETIGKIALPTTPVSVQYATTAFPPNLTTVKTFSTPAAGSTTVQNLVHNLQQQQSQAHHQQIVHQKSVQPTVTFGPTGLRPSLPTAPNPPAVATSTPAAATNSSTVTGGGAVGQGSAQFQRLKVEDALSYLDQVKYKFGNQPQVYNDFLDIMKEFKSQSIDTPGVIARVSCLFKGHPELIVGFNTFLPPGYKIEVTCTDGVVNVPGLLGGGMQTIVHTPHGIHTMGAHGSMSVLQPNNAATAAAAAASLPQTPVSTAAAAVAAASVRPLPMQTPPQQQGPKFTPQPIKSETLLQQQPAPAHIQTSNFVTSTPLHGPPSTLHLNSNANNATSGGQAIGGNAANNQPVEFNHAINYVNKIKNRFQGQPDVYKQFLEILHTYQKDQKAIKEGNPPSNRYLTETEVYAQVSKLFQNQEDLLNEFGQFLPEATNDQSQNAILSGKPKKPPPGPYKQYNSSSLIGTSTVQKYGTPGVGPIGGAGAAGTPGGTVGVGKRPPGNMAHPPAKKAKITSGVLRDVTLAEAGKYGTLNEFAFFDKVRKALRSTEVYNNFLRCLVLFNQEIINRQELLQLTSSFLQRHPDLFKWFKDFLGFKEGGGGHHGHGLDGHHPGATLPPQAMPGRDRGDAAMEIDYATCKRLGASYCALPKDFVPPKCIGRTPLCKEVLNDTWVSFPSWSEDSQFVTSRKTQFEEFIYRTEDERFEFDVVLETNRDTIKVLECVQKKMSRMPPEEAARYRLDDCLGGNSPTIHQRAIRRIYGDKAGDIIDGIKRNPVVAVPLVLRRLKAKDEEWRDVQKGFNKTWREQNEKFYLKSLDHQGLMFKQSDVRTLRSKSLLNEIETLYDERHEQQEEAGGSDAVASHGPHLNLDYAGDHKILEDANILLIHHVKRQTSIHKDDKHKIKVLLRHFLLDLFKNPRQELSDDEKEDEEEEEKEDGGSSAAAGGAAENESDTNGGSKATRSERARKKKDDSGGKEESGGTSNKKNAKEKDVTEADVRSEVAAATGKDGRRTPLHARGMSSDESYSHIMGNNNWYLFLRLHHILCDRLNKMYCQALIITNEEAKERKDRRESTAVALRLKPKRLSVTCYGPRYFDTRGSRRAAFFTPFSHVSTFFSEPFNNLFSSPLSSSSSNLISSDLQSREIEPENYYPAFLDMVKNVLDGNMEPLTYEDTLREMFGIHAYVAFTMDKVVGNAVRQLQHLVSDEAAVECHELFLREDKSGNGATGGVCSSAADRLIPELIYQKRAEKLLVDENCLKIFIYHQARRLTIEMIDTETESQNSEQEDDSRKWLTYVERFVQPGESVSDACKLHLSKKPVFLPRGIRSYKKSPFAKTQVERSRQLVKAKESSNSEDHSEKSKSASKDNKVGGDKDSTGKGGVNRLNHEPSSATNNGIVHGDNLQCQFNPKNLKMLYVIQSENCFYRNGALRRAKDSHKKVSRRKTGDFSRWHSTWISQHVSDSQHGAVESWFMGKTPELVLNKTQKVVKSDPNVTPYRTFYKFRAEILK